MNTHNASLPESDDDPLLEEMLSHLKHLEPPLETRIANRLAVAAALSSLITVNRQRHLPWWRRSVSIPVPLAVSLVVLMAFALQSSFRAWQDRSPIRVAAPGHPTEIASPGRGDKTAIAKPTANAHPTWKYYETETYLCGVGRLNSESYYVIKE